MPDSASRKEAGNVRTTAQHHRMPPTCIRACGAEPSTRPVVDISFGGPATNAIADRRPADRRAFTAHTVPDQYRHPVVSSGQQLIHLLLHRRGSFCDDGPRQPQCHLKRCDAPRLVRSPRSADRLRRRGARPVLDRPGETSAAPRQLDTSSQVAVIRSPPPSPSRTSEPQYRLSISHEKPAWRSAHQASAPTHHRPDLAEANYQLLLCLPTQSGVCCAYILNSSGRWQLVCNNPTNVRAVLCGLPWASSYLLDGA